jgi:hypothetical protein
MRMDMASSRADLVAKDHTGVVFSFERDLRGGIVDGLVGHVETWVRLEESTELVRWGETL